LFSIHPDSRSKPGWIENKIREDCMKITVDCAASVGSLNPFWASTGFTPANLLLTSDMRQQIAYCGSIPRKGLQYARIHYLLELVDVQFNGASPSAL
jgi:hypothetical protein